MPGDIDAYTDLLIRIGAPRLNSTAPSVEAVIDGDSLFYGGSLELNQDELFAVEADNQVYGQMLAKALFTDPVRRAYDRASAKAAERSDGRLRVRLQIDAEVARYEAVRWERMLVTYGGQPAPVSIATQTPFSRFAGLEGDSAEPLAVRPVRLSVCLSNPANLPNAYVPIDIEPEVRNLQRTIGTLRQNYSLSVSLAPGRTGLPDDLRKSLLSDGYSLIDGPVTLDVLVNQITTAHVVHFLGHGAYRPATDTAALYLEKAGDGTLALALDTEILPRLNGAGRLAHLLVLMACEGAKTTGMQPLAGLAGKLVKAGVPAVFAMQTKLPIDDAPELTRRFYADLLDHGIVDLAANTARSYLYSSRRADFSIPALYMRLQDGKLLAPDPALAALQAILRDAGGAARKPRLPIDVAVTTGQPVLADLERLALMGEPAVDLQDATLAVFQDKGRPRPGFILITGSPGTAKTTYLHQLARVTAEISISSEDRVMPVNADLAGFANFTRSFGDSFGGFLAGELGKHWTGMTREGFHGLLPAESPLTFRFLIDCDDALSDRQRVEAHAVLVSFARENPSHQYVVATDLYNAEDFLRVAAGLVTQIHVIKPITQTRAEQYLASVNEAAASDLLDALDDKRLFDLARPPWLFVRMLEQARVGILPESRASVMKRILDEQIAGVETDRGLRARAMDVLQGLAWAMTSNRRSMLALSEAFAIVEARRANRGFSAEDLFDQLVDQRLLSRVGQDALRFAYPAIQSYCCAAALKAMPSDQRDTLLDDITASLGRLTRLRWWEDTVIMLAGLVAPEDTSYLIELILYGGGAAEGDRVFLAARCIQESGHASAETMGRVTDALTWRSKIGNEPRSNQRVRAVEALAMLQAETAIPHLAALAADKVRKNFAGEDAYEYPDVRLAAALALMRMGGPAEAYLRSAYPAVARTLELRKEGKTEELGAVLTAPVAGPPAELSPAVAAFTLGQIRSDRAAELLIAAYDNAALSSDTRGCVTDTLKLLGPRMLSEKVLPRFFAETGDGTLPPETLKERRYRYDQFADLAGQVKWRDPLVRAFLERCVFEWQRVSLKGRAMKAVANIYTPADGDDFGRYKQCFERIASGDLTGIALSQPVDPRDATYLQLSALEALSCIGDKVTLSFLRNQRPTWPAELERQFFLTSEEIYWRAASSDLE